MTNYSMNIAHLGSHYARVQLGSSEIDARGKAKAIRNAMLLGFAAVNSNAGKELTFQFESQNTSGTSEEMA